MVEREKRFRMNGVGWMRVFGENGGARKREGLREILKRVFSL